MNDIKYSKGFSQLDYISNLSKNWNRNNADSFSKNLIKKCKIILQSLEYEPNIFLTSRDSIQFEYEKPNGEYLEFEIYDESIKFFKIDKNQNELSGYFSSDNQIQKMSNLINEFMSDKLSNSLERTNDCEYRKGAVAIAKSY